MATWPYLDWYSPLSSSVLTANTVLEKLSAKPINRAVPISMPAKAWMPARLVQ